VSGAGQANRSGGYSLSFFPWSSCPKPPSLPHPSALAPLLPLLSSLALPPTPSAKPNHTCLGIQRNGILFGGAQRPCRAGRPSVCAAFICGLGAVHAPCTWQEAAAGVTFLCPLRACCDDEGNDCDGEGGMVW